MGVVLNLTCNKRLKGRKWKTKENTKQMLKTDLTAMLNGGIVMNSEYHDHLQTDAVRL
jgi:hypothetical protein